MNSKSLDDFLETYGTCLTISKAALLTGMNERELTQKAKELSFVFGAQCLRPIGLEHLPALPADASIHRWSGGTRYRIPVKDTPGILSITLHNTSSHAEDRLLTRDDEDISNS